MAVLRIFVSIVFSPKDIGHVGLGLLLLTFKSVSFVVRTSVYEFRRHTIHD